MLYLVATPIGNLADITYRAINTLKSVDLILCEDTRTSSVLLRHYNIATPVKSYHKFSEKQREEEILKWLQEGKNIALISDAGTPGVHDPGQNLVAKCHENHLPVTCLPGPCAPITALTLAGMATDSFQFIGFLPKKEQERKKRLLAALFYPGVTLFFESPKRLDQTLREMAALGPKHTIAIARELTKIHEECLHGVPQDFIGRTWRGEIVVLVEGKAQLQPSLSPQEHVAELQKQYNLSKSEAIKLAATLRGTSKKEVYRLCC